MHTVSLKIHAYTCTCILLNYSYVKIENSILQKHFWLDGEYKTVERGKNVVASHLLKMQSKQQNVVGILRESRDVAWVLI